MRILVTGGAGFIGTHVVNKLVQQGHEVIVVDLFTGNNKRAKYFIQDIISPEIERLFPVDSVIHLAAQTSVPNSVLDPDFDRKTNLEGSLNVLRLAEKYNVKKFIYTNTAAEIGQPYQFPINEEHPCNPVSPYGTNKNKFYQLLKKSTVPYISLRLANVYGPGQDFSGEGGVVAIFTHALLQNKTPLIFGSGNQTRDFVYVSDVVRVIVLALEKGEGQYNVGSGEEITIVELFNKIQSNIGTKIKPKHEEEREGDIERSVFSIEKISKELDWKPTTTLQQGLQKTIVSMQRPKVSVVICAYNAASCIQKIFDSLKKQSFTDFEIVVANDGSTDATAEIARKNGARVIDMEHQGLSAARNVGITNSKADIVAIIDADCYASPNWVEEIYNQIHTKGETVVTGNTKIPHSTFLGDCISGLGYPGGAHLGFENMWHVSKEGYTDHLAGGNCAFKKETILGFGAFNEKLTITGDDVYLSMKVLENGLKIKYNSQMIMYHKPRKDLKTFLHWHYTRGRGSYFFKQHVSSLGSFYKLRVWSTKNMIKKYWRSPKLFIMIPLLGLSFFTQKLGYWRQQNEKL